VDPEAALKLNPSSAPLRAALVKMLRCNTKTAEQVALLQGLLNDPDHRVQVAALSTLSSFMVSADENTVRRFIKDPSPEARIDALWMLSEKKVPDLDELVTAACQDPDADVRNSAFRRAGANDDTHLIEPMLKALELGVEDDYYICSILEKPENAKILERCAMSPHANLRAVAALTINGQDEAPNFIPLLLKMSGENDPDVLRHLASGLAYSRDPSALKALQQIAERTKGEALCSAIEALGLTDQPSLIGYLEPFLTSPDRQVRRAARSAIRGLKETEVPPTN
jgi:HEAT repeat protein